MKRKKRLLSVLMIVTALIIMQLPVSEADAATSASDFRIEGSTLVKYRGSDKNVSIPDTVEIIGSSAFEDDANVELVVVPNSVKRIEAYAFWGCDNLDTVVLGSGLTEVGDYAFAGCSGLRQMTLPSNITSIGILAFGDCIHMTDISIPVETSFIHETAFNGCSRLTIHCEKGSVADDFAQVFYERQSQMPEFEDVPDNIPSEQEPAAETPQPEPTAAPPAEEPGNFLGSTQVVGNRAVVFVNSKKPQVFGDEQKEAQELPLVTNLDGYDWSRGIPKYTIVDGTVVADQAYYRSDLLEDVILPPGIREVGQFSFARSSLKSLTLPEGVETISYGAFYHCDGLETVTLPDTILCVEPQAFSCTPWVDRFLNGEDGSSGQAADFGGGGDSGQAESMDGAQLQDSGDFLVAGGVLVAYRGNVSDVTIPEGVRVIAGEACRGHGEIVSVSLPDSLQVIGEGAFQDCSELEKITFGENVTSIKDRAFEGTKIENVSIPSSVNTLGLKAFGSAQLTYEGVEPEHTYESSASRLSNASYRIYNHDEQQTPGLSVVGLEGASASLTDSDRSYTLSIRLLEVKSDMENACLRALRFLTPEDMPVYELTLTDESGIPLTKLGRQKLTVTLPVPESLKGQELKVLTLDRNGQLELAASDHVLLDGVEVLRFQTSYLSQYGILATGILEEGSLAENHVDMDSFSQAPQSLPQEFSYNRHVLQMASGAVLLTGGILLLSHSFFGKKKMKPQNEAV